MDTREIVRRMVATGDWSEAGAVGFVSFLTHGPDAPASREWSTPVAAVRRRSGMPHVARAR